ncbi:septum formation family protein [Streptomyces racemochromogenes]|uniref:Septum formation family protein n=1 Tax=Streptomyces racemochromogenes TaxID=67353 RepID=A0ABW7PL62_9ACTN
MSRPPRSPCTRAAHGAALALVLLLGISGAGRAYAAAPSGDTDELTAGDCFNASTAPKDYKTGQVTQGPLSVDVVPCGEPHQSEAYAVLTLPDGPYPGEGGLLRIAREKCGGATLTRYVGPHAKLSATLTEYFYGPAADGWKAGDRRLICYLSEPGGKTTGSLRATAS